MSTALDTVALSVVIPAFNEADYLPATLDSLQRQDFDGSYEVVVVDNNSTDDTALVARRHGARVVTEAQPGVCAARQRGTTEALGEIVVSTDADTVHPPGWLSRLDATLRSTPEAVAVAGPCRYQDPPWWAAVFPPLYFRAVDRVHASTGRVFYVTATNLAFRRAAFPGYDTGLTQGGDEVDFLRRLRGRGRVVWDQHNPVVTSSRRMNQGLVHTLVVSYGYHYAFSYLVSKVTSRGARVAPAIRRWDEGQVRRRRLRWRAGLGAGLGVGALALARRRRERR